ncbi:hypothetical protein HDU99_005749, partial [Rhizoclosmatium hyalinum]
TPSRGVPLSGLEGLFGKKVRGVLVEALVYKVAERSFDVIVERYGVEKRCWVEDCDSLFGCSFEKEEKRLEEDGKSGGRVLSVYWKRGYFQSVDVVTKALEGLKVEDEKKNDVMIVDDIVEDDDESGWETDETGTVAVVGGPAALLKKKAEEAKKLQQQQQQQLQQQQQQTAPSTPAPKHGGRHNGNQNGTPNTARKSRKRSDMDPSSTITQKIRIFDRIPVVLVADISRSPPEIKVYLIHPEAVAMHKAAIVDERVVTYDANANVSCPAVEDEAH